MVGQLTNYPEINHYTGSTRTYTLVETDGTKRIVEYEADDKNGFNAVVHKIGTPKHVEEYKVSKPSYEPIPYQHDYQVSEEAFMPSYASYEH
ncbi:Cuticle protein 8 [Papilio machaon]|uniref:Cuticle protein 8 n=1 Tax=Papilio machaon TaxID=76193 RepID=A0A0N0PCL3_PAPMA|nr:Cuticle protein 8 [Papilio machaon]